MAKGFDRFIEDFVGKCTEEPVVEYIETHSDIEKCNLSPENIIHECKSNFKSSGELSYIKEAFKLHLLEFKVDPKKMPWQEIVTKGDKAIMSTAGGKKVSGYLLNKVFYYRASGKIYGFESPEVTTECGATAGVGTAEVSTPNKVNTKNGKKFRKN